MGFIYRIKNSINNKVYIGQTKNDPNIRWNSHKKSIRDLSINRPFVDALRKLGIDKFTFEVLIICLDNDLDYIEREQIKKYNSLHPNGYNYESGGGSGKTPSDEMKQKFRERMRIHFENGENRRKIGEKVRSAYLDPAVRENKSNQKKDFYRSDKGKEWRKEHSKTHSEWYKTEEGQNFKKNRSQKLRDIAQTEEGKRKNKLRGEKHSQWLKTPEGQEFIERNRGNMKKLWENKPRKNYVCEICNYSSGNDKSKLTRHLETKRHKEKMDKVSV